MSQLQQDLEALLSEVDAGWANGAGDRVPAAERNLPPYARFGEGGCMLVGMERMQDRQGLNRSLDADERLGRREAMRRAMGFSTPSAMFDWNDSQTDPDQIKHRIKEALNAL